MQPWKWNYLFENAQHKRDLLDNKVQSAHDAVIAIEGALVSGQIHRHQPGA